MFCGKCGTEITQEANFCPKCGHKLYDSVEVTSGDCIFLPKNVPALWSYYLGVATLLCCFFTGIPALVLGIIALRRARQHPEQRGALHAWFGIVVGGLSVILPLILTIIALS